MSQIGFEKRRYYLGLFASKREAARAYDQAVQELAGDFACKNNC